MRRSAPELFLFFCSQRKLALQSSEYVVMVSRASASKSSTGALEAMRRLEGIVASAMDGIITINDAQQIILFNPAAERMFDLPAAEALGQHISRFMPQRYRAAHA